MKKRNKKVISLFVLMMSLVLGCGSACAGNEIEYIPTWILVEDDFITIEGYFKNNMNKEVSDFEDFTLFLEQHGETAYENDQGDLYCFDIEPYGVMEYFFQIEGTHNLNNGEYYCAQEDITADCSFTYYY